jgi:hypothetical protein
MDAHPLALRTFTASVVAVCFDSFSSAKSSEYTERDSGKYNGGLPSRTRRRILMSRWRNWSNIFPDPKPLQPAADQQELPIILQKMGERVDDFVREIDDLIADEDVTREKLNAKD